MAFRLVNRERLLAPKKCLICETKPGHRVVDTGYNLVATTVFDKLRGRKYVCEACGEKIGKALGMVVTRKVEEMKEEIIRLQNDVEAAKKMAHLNDILNKFYEELTRQEAQNAVVSDE